MTLEEIKNAIDEGQRVFWKNSLYEVMKWKYEYMIIYNFGHRNQNCIGLTNQDEKTLNGEENDFYIEGGYKDSL